MQPTSWARFQTHHLRTRTVLISSGFLDLRFKEGCESAGCDSHLLPTVFMLLNLPVSPPIRLFINTTACDCCLYTCLAVRATLTVVINYSSTQKQSWSKLCCLTQTEVSVATVRTEKATLVSLLQKLATIANPAFYVLCLVKLGSRRPVLLAHEYVVLSPCFPNLSSKGECKATFRLKNTRTFPQELLFIVSSAIECCRDGLSLLAWTWFPPQKKRMGFFHCILEYLQKISSVANKSFTFTCFVLFCAEIITILYTHYKLINPQV